MSAQTPFPEPSSDPPPYSPPPPPPQYGVPPFASWGRRAGAALLDGLILLLIVGVPLLCLYILLLMTIEEQDADTILGLTWWMAFIVFSLLYFPLTMRRRGVHNGQTWGKQAVGIRVVNDSRERFTGGKAIVRELLVKGILMNLCTIVWILDCLSPLWDDRNQAWHDMICSTLVLKDPPAQ